MLDQVRKSAMANSGWKTNPKSHHKWGRWRTNLSDDLNVLWSFFVTPTNHIYGQSFSHSLFLFKKNKKLLQWMDDTWKIGQLNIVF